MTVGWSRSFPGQKSFWYCIRRYKCIVSCQGVVQLGGPVSRLRNISPFPVYTLLSTTSLYALLYWSTDQYNNIFSRQKYTTYRTLGMNPTYNKNHEAINTIIMSVMKHCSGVNLMPLFCHVDLFYLGLFNNTLNIMVL